MAATPQSTRRRVACTAPSEGSAVMLDRRAFLGTLGLLAAPLAAEAQQAPKVARIGYLSTNLNRPGFPRGSNP